MHSETQPFHASTLASSKGTAMAFIMAHLGFLKGVFCTRRT
jgi:hypothetical protein